MKALIKLVFAAILIIISIIKERKRRSAFSLNDLKELFEEYQDDIDAEKKNYKGSWSTVENWKQTMKDKYDQIEKHYQKEGSTKAFFRMCDKLEIELENGLHAIQEGNNPLISKEQQTTILAQALFLLIILIPCFFVYLALSICKCGIFVLTAAFAYFFFPNGIPYSLSDEPIKFKLKDLIAILLLSSLGWLLNSWVYVQSEEIQLTVMMVLPIFYGLTYYKLKHKQSVREL